MNKPIKIIDLFAGPGGLGEGFSSYRSKRKQVFKIAISIEKEDSAHRTLLLRSLFRQFEPGKAPESYYAFLRGELGKQPEDELYQQPELQEALEKARTEAQKLTLGEEPPENVYKKIRDVLNEEECILIGGPPCQAYSLVGRARNYGDKTKKYCATSDHRNFLYQEYLKIISKFQPKVFVMENVKGILSAKIEGEPIFNSILNDLEDPYKSTNVKPDKGREKHRYKIFSLVKNKDSLDPHDYVIEAENYGLPQARHRVILLGIRDDIASGASDFQRLKTSKDTATVRQVISDLPKLRSRLSKSPDSAENWKSAVSNISDDVIDSLAENEHVPDNVLNSYREQLKNVSNAPSTYGSDKGVTKMEQSFDENMPKKLAQWFKDERLGKYVTNHETRGHIEGDLHRYFYYSIYAQHEKKSPKSLSLPEVFWPNHKNFNSGKFADRFRVQLADSHGTTITSHISKDGHYFIHYDPLQCRSLTVREAARIQTFPDNYYFVGNRTQQYVQVGNAVPPFLARQIAEIVAQVIGV